MTLRLVFHGGRCCGIKTIYGFEWSPSTEISAKEKWPGGTDTWGNLVLKRSQDKNGRHVSSDLDFFTDEAPKETMLDRLRRLVAFCRRERPQGLIEVVLADKVRVRANGRDDGCRQVAIWGPVLEAEGFTLVTKAKNSNSDNTIYVYHLVYDDGGEIEAEYDEDEEEVA